MAKMEYIMLVNERKVPKEKKRIVEEAKNLIYKNMHNKIVIQDIAKQLSITPQYLSVVLKKAKGMSVNEYIIQKKIGLAENLLTYSNYGLEEISYYLGFCSQSHFGKKFKRLKGITSGKFGESMGKRILRIVVRRCGIWLGKAAFRVYRKLLFLNSFA